MGFFEKLKAGLAKTKNSFFGKINSIFKGFRRVDEDLMDELEEALITGDVGVETTEEILDELRSRIKEKKLTEPEEVKAELFDILRSLIGDGEPIAYEDGKLTVVLVVGVNGVGKTTSIAKMANVFKSDGKKVLLCAADTFRAAAIDQIGIWADRIGVELIKQSEGSDPAAVVFDAVHAAKKRGADILIIDTAGRLHNKKNLMNELKKISRIVHEQAEGCSLEVLLALDATTGQNAVSQAKLFNEACDITGIILTKLDGTAKGGIIITITDDLKIPVKLVTVGEKIDDLQPFVAKDFVNALFE